MILNLYVHSDLLHPRINHHLDKYIYFIVIKIKDNLVNCLR